MTIGTNRRPARVPTHFQVRRPQTFAEVVGLGSAKGQLQGILDAQNSGIPLPSLLFVGAAGAGKTTLAEVFAKEAGLTFHRTVGGEITSIERLWEFCEGMAGDLRRDGRAIAFVDEIHAIGAAGGTGGGGGKMAGEVWLPLLEDRALYHGLYGRIFEVGSGARKQVRLLKAAAVREFDRREGMEEDDLDLPSELFTITESVSHFPGIIWIGATTDEDRLSAAVRRRFPVRVAIPEYSLQDIQGVVEKGVERLSVDLQRRIPWSLGASLEIAKRARRSPSEALNLLAAVLPWNVMTVLQDDHATEGVIQSCETLGIGAKGLREVEIATLKYLDEHGPIGVAGLASFLASRGVTKRSFEAVTEPFLVREGLITRSSRGREITKLGKEALR